MGFWGAGGGGGCTGYYYGGAGGGESGGVNELTSQGFGGTQSAGGNYAPIESWTSGQFLASNGGYDRGWGYAAGGGQADAGAGGGGGYYGGGSNNVVNGTPNGSGTHSAGGGGSGYVHPSLVVDGVNLAGTAGSGVAPAGLHKPSGAGNGGANGTTLSAVADGNAGAAWIQTSGELPPEDLVEGRTTVEYTGSRRRFSATQTGVVRVRMWGGGGAGGSYGGSTRTDRSGGPGGYTDIFVPVVAGDELDVRCARGGQTAISDGGSNYNGGDGGWPNGGNGGKDSSLSAAMGGGGGSSLLYKNEVLIAVAGGGGGSTGYFGGGAGGGTTGLQGDTDGTYNGTGGTQTAGGTSGGASLQGAHGYSAGDQNTAIAGAGAGGGGGYYGGGTNQGYTANQRGSGGGGSGYIAPGYVGQMETAAAGNKRYAPHGGGLKPEGIAEGGLNHATASSATDGGDGLVWLDYVVETLPTSKTVYDYTGAEVHYLATSEVTFEVKAWGAGGSGSWGLSSTTGPGGPGGFTLNQLTVQAGDVITIHVGQGAQGDPSTALQAGSIGGWPDGGSGGTGNGARRAGGGGGSTRLFVNGVVKMVAGGGGGGGRSTGNNGGAGGGSSGTAGNAGGTNGTPGTQSAGGINPSYTTDQSYSGSFLKGGNGFGEGKSRFNTDGTGGGGAGGGYYGGGGGSGLSSGGATGAGGSGYDATGLGVTIAGDAPTNIPPRQTDPDYVAGLAVGGPANPSTTYGTPVDGGNGRLVLSFIDDLGAGKTTVSDVGTFQYKATAAGSLKVKLWGAGGGGAYSTAADSFSNTRAGAGGYIYGELNLAADDVVRVEVGEGGQGASGTIAAVGGWPDGGAGGISSTTYRAGGGGGSTRIYVNDALKMIVGGGGGCGRPLGTSGEGSGGAGGAPYGQRGPGTQAGYGATPREFGICPGNVLGHGAALTGGNGQAFAGGGGGGGGYFGGGAGQAVQHGGGGGSGWIASDVFASAAEQSSGPTAPNASDTDYVSGAAAGAAATTAASTAATDGGNGLVVMDFTVAGEAGIWSIADANRVATHTGLPQLFKVDADGALAFKMWGAGGGGGFRSAAAPGQSGAGAFMQGSLGLEAGDLLRLEVGGGGGGGATYRGGYGGWPDGGIGGLLTATTFSNGGGGGSTRIYINGVLMAVAAGGGGGGTGTAGEAATQAFGGAGGAVTGQSGGATATANTHGTGGSQATGGVCAFRSSDAVSAGSSLRGGMGWPTSLASPNQASTASNSSGAGGGGGYYGGGGSTAPGTATVSGGAGGGSSLVPGTASGVAGSFKVPGGSTDTDYVVGVGVGVDGTQTTTPANGGGGYIKLVYTDGVPGYAAGESFEDVLLTAPAGNAERIIPGPMPGPIVMTTPGGGVLVGGPPIGGAFDPILMTAPDGAPIGDGNAEGLIPEIEMVMDLGGQGIIEAVVNVPLVDYDIVLTEPGAQTPTGEVNYVVEAFPGPVRMTPPRAVFFGYTTTEPFEHDLVLTAPEGVAESGSEGGQEPFEHSITLSLETMAVATGAALVDGVPASGWVSPPSDRFLSRALMTSPEGVVATPDQETDGLPFEHDILVSYVEGAAQTGVTVSTEGFENDVITYMGSEVVVTGAVKVDGLPNSGYVGNQNARFLVRVPLSAPNGAITGPANIEALVESVDITLAPPNADNFRSVTVVGTILPARIVLSAPRGIGHDGSTVIAIGAPLDDIILTAPEGLPQVIPDAKWDPITVDYVDGYVEVDEPGFAPLRYKRSHVPGRVPTLEVNEIAFNEADGVLYSRDGGGVVRGFAYGAYRDDRGYAPDGGVVGNVLSASGAWIAPTPLDVAPVLLPMPAAARLTLSENIVDVPATITPEVGTVYYRPFYMPKAKVLSTLALEVVDAASATVWMGVCRWNPRNRTPGDTLILGQIGVDTSGLKQITPGARLEPGWYAAMFNVTGADGATFKATRAAKTVASDFTLVGNLTAPYEGSLSPAPTPTTYADEAWAVVQAETA